MVDVLSFGERRSRKPHQCFHCYRQIPAGSKLGFQSNVGDGSFYTLYWHIDCERCAAEHRKLSGNDYDYGDGFGPLRDDWAESGEYKSVCDAWRGFYPHVVVRMELSDQLRKATQ
tara:strand:- start:167 stop:511 length:345 start_codon:yes stop_codon:yes gene_type:complete